jgi:hypothetical protein
MRVIYGTDIDMTVPDTLSGEEIMATLKENYSELSRGTFTITTENDERVMRVTVQSGSKA